MNSNYVNEIVSIMKNGLPPGTIRNKDGIDTMSDKRIGTIRKEWSKG